MQDLTLVGVDGDGEHLVLASPDGTRYRLPLDETLRAAVRRDRARLGDLRVETQVSLTPRQIQARIRAGEDPFDIAEATGVPVEHVRRYERPVLAEREHVAALARALQVRWRDGSGRTPQLEELVAERFAARGVTGPAVWDAWRREDGLWVVQLLFRTGSRERRAQWAFDVVRSTIEALDDEARWLSSVDREDDPLLPGRRLAAVREEVYDVDAHGRARPSGEQAPVAGLPAEPVPLERTPRRAQPPGPTGEGLPSADDGPAGEEPGRETAERGPSGRTLDLLDQLRSRRGRRQPLADPESDPGSADDVEALTWAELEALTAPADDPGDVEDDADDAPVDAQAVAEAGDPPAAHPPASHPEEATDAWVLELPEAPGGGETVVADAEAGSGEDRWPAGEVTPGGDAEEPVRQAPDDAPASAGTSSADAGRASSRRRRPRTERRSMPAAQGGPASPTSSPTRDAGTEDAGTGGGGTGGGGTDDGGEAPRTSQPEAPKGESKRSRRPSVPSWDDIMFGAKRD